MRYQNRVFAVLALSHLVVLAGCGQKILPNKKAASQNLTTGGAPAGTPAPNAAPGAAPAPSSSLATSFAAIDLDADSAHGVARLSFTHWPTPSQLSTVNPMVVPLKSAAAAGGADMDPPPGAKDYAAHLTCATADCASATIVLTKHQPPLQGQAVIHIDHRAATGMSLETTGTPKGLESKIVTALQSRQDLVMSTSIVRIEGGPIFFGVEARIPPGATVPGRPADGGRIMRFSGQLGDRVTVTMSYVDTQDDVAAGSRQDFEGAATFTDADQSVHLSFAGPDRIKALAFGNFKI